MSEYKPLVTDGKVIGDSAFFTLANDTLGKECKRLCGFTESLDKDPAKKKENVAEYKCAKYRYAAVSLVHSILYNNNLYRKQQNLEQSHYLLKPFDEVFREYKEYCGSYDVISVNEKPDYSLYCVLLAIIEKQITELKVKLSCANDFERIELEERIGGLLYGKACLDEAWQKRKEVVK